TIRGVAYQFVYHLYLSSPLVRGAHPIPKIKCHEAIDRIYYLYARIIPILFLSTSNSSNITIAPD
ncbi:MAG: hypothetical protein QME49_09910, partial [bacterium]|nr:hypothetical protein [bacterium]